jgi:hypothetical protein
MRLQYWIPVIVFFLLIPVATAFIDGDITITPADWAVAGGPSVPIKIHVENVTLTEEAVDYTNVKLTVTASTLGTILPKEINLDENGNATLYFTPGTVKGKGTGTIWVYYNETIQNTTIAEINIDHAEPKFYTELNYPSSATVTSTIDITVQLKDRYGNEIDGKNETEYLVFRDSEDSLGGFLQGTEYVHVLSVPISDDGRGSVEYQLGTVAGLSVLMVTAPPTVVNNVQYLEIYGIAGTPTDMVPLIYSASDKDNTNPHTALADGVDTFSIYYLVSDQYGNPVPNKMITVKITKGLEITTSTFRTNHRGLIALSYGPSTILHEVELDAFLTELSHLKSFSTLKFIPGGPVRFSLAAVPPIIPSRDVPTREESNTTVRVRVLDTTGRGLSNETVRIWITNESYNFESPEVQVTDTSSFDRTDDEWDEVTVETDAEGYAYTTLYAARFNQSSEGYSTNWIGVADLSAELVSDPPLSASSSVTFKNYPFLRLESSLDKSTIALNDTVNLSVCLFGDGYTPPHKPIDALLVFSRGLTMLDNRGQFLIDPAIHVRWAVRNFTGYFEDSSDRVGLWTFGDQGWADLLLNPKMKQSYLVGDDGPQGTDDPKAVEGDESVNGGEGYPGNGKNYTSYATPDTGDPGSDSAFPTDPLSMEDVNDAVEYIVPFNEENQAITGISLRYGICQGLHDAISNPRPDPAFITAIIVLIDQEWNWFGDPLARNNPIVTSDSESGAASTPSNAFLAFDGPDCSYSGAGPNLSESHWSLVNYTTTTSWQNMSNYAKDNNVLIYVVSYTDSLKADRQNDLTLLAEGTGGKHLHASDADELNATFGRIAEELIELASVNTTLDLNFTSMSVTTVDGLQYLPGNSVLNYSYVPDLSTYITSWKEGTVVPDQLPIPPYPSNLNPLDLHHDTNGSPYTDFPYTMNQTDQWENNNLDIYAGNISIGQNWCANILLEARMLGGIEIFGGDSLACFSNEDLGEECDILPPLSLSVLETVSGEFTVPNDLEILNVSWEFDDSMEYLHISWNLSYMGEHTVPVQQTIYYRFSSDGITWDPSWVAYDVQVTEDVGLIPSASDLPVRDRVGKVWFRIHAIELGANENYATYDSDPINITDMYNIRIR